MTDAVERCADPKYCVRISPWILTTDPLRDRVRMQMLCRIRRQSASPRLAFLPVSTFA